MYRGETPAPVSAAPTKHADQQFDISNVNSNYNPMLDVSVMVLLLCL
jgi:hypothetical protein